MSTITKQAVQAVADLKAGYTLGHADVVILNELARIALASLEENNSGRNPALAYADSYRDMANHGVESIPVWSVITDLERNIARQHRWLDAAGKTEKSCKGPVWITCSAQFQYDRPRPLDPLVRSFLTGALGL